MSQAVVDGLDDAGGRAATIVLLPAVVAGMTDHESSVGAGVVIGVGPPPPPLPLPATTAAGATGTQIATRSSDASTRPTVGVSLLCGMPFILSPLGFEAAVTASLAAPSADGWSRLPRHERTVPACP